MPSHIDLPDDLRALIEKRGGSDRRQQDPTNVGANDRRSGADRRDAEAISADQGEEDTDAESAPFPIDL
ncbi:MAG: hypothetical protein AAGJ46_16990 [Planctomycetota bacterium]